jgi:AcrR family transcriptional regulator
VSQPAGARLPAAERRSAIVAAALEVFGSGSYTGSTTAEIARAAGVSEPIIYRHFPSKRELWCACVEEAWLQLQETLDRKAASLRGERALDDVAGSRSPWADPLLPNLWIQGVTEAAEDEAIQRFLRAHVREVHDYVAAGIRRLQESGALARDRDADAEAWILIGGGLLRSFADRLGGVVRPGEVAAIGRERRRWLTGA